MCKSILSLLVLFCGVFFNDVLRPYLLQICSPSNIFWFLLCRFPGSGNRGRQQTGEQCYTQRVLWPLSQSGKRTECSYCLHWCSHSSCSLGTVAAENMKTLPGPVCPVFNTVTSQINQFKCSSVFRKLLFTSQTQLREGFSDTVFG